MSKPLREPVDSKRFYLDFWPFEKRSVGRSGLQLFNILYWHGALARYIHDGSKHVIKYDPRDLSRVYLLEVAVRTWKFLTEISLILPCLWGKSRIVHAGCEALESGQLAKTCFSKQ